MIYQTPDLLINLNSIIKYVEFLRTGVQSEAVQKVYKKNRVLK